MKRNYIGENIRIYRERSKLTQQQLADKIGISWEMISRYERAASSPLKKLELLANALGVSESQLIEEHVPESIHPNELRVPLFTHIPSPARFTPFQTNYYYSCPEWAKKLYEEIIAIDSTIVKSNIPNFTLHGVLFISTKNTLVNGDYIVVKSYESLEVILYRGEKQENILGKLVAQELKY